MSSTWDPQAHLQQMEAHLKGLGEFWRQRGIDPAGGYHTTFDQEGHTVPQQRKTLVAQTRILWTFTALAEAFDDTSFLEMANHGVDYLEKQFLDADLGGWFWSRGSDDLAKIMYGQSFALYALATYARVASSDHARQLACDTFDVMHKAADIAEGGFWENCGRDWSPEDTDSGRRKSLDIHLHLLESFTALAELTGDPTHLRRLREIRELLLEKMIDWATVIPGNQYNGSWVEQLPIVISRTWIAERIGDEALPPGQIVTSYGHNLELGWLLGWADQVLDGDPTYGGDLVYELAAHTLRYGFDHTHGGIYREGPPEGKATDTDKEFWQNSEALIGFLHAFERTGKQEYADAFASTWDFARRHLIHPEHCEWRIRTTRDGSPIDSTLGNQWTGGYHTVRAAIESVKRLQRFQ
ncbi:MAG: AGE family epimerase/isomerase [Propionibacteriaceae bacterium]|nr:AGE family epimerase/isomerase [Propionibacteriaceae bacterium]